MSAGRRPIRFTAVIYQVGINRCVDIPRRTEDRLKLKGYLSVLVALEGEAAETTIVRGGKGYRVFLKNKLREMSGVDTGDRVTVSIHPREGPSRPRLPADLAAALRKQQRARKAFDELTPRLRRDMIAMVNQAKTEPTRRKRITRAIDLLKERAARRSRTSSSR